MRLEIDDQAFTHAKHGVGVQVLAVRHKQVGDERRIPFRPQHGVHVAGPVRMAAHLEQHDAAWAIYRHRVFGGFDAPKTITPIGFRAELGAQLHRCIRALLQVVKTFRVAGPDIQLATRNRLATQVGHAPAVIRGHARQGALQVGVHGQLRRAFPEERALHCGFGGGRGQGRAFVGLDGFGLRNAHHLHREAQRVRHEDELLPLLVALLARGGEELDAGHPFVGCELHLAREGVQVVDE